MDPVEHSHLLAVTRAMSDWYQDLDTEVAYPGESLRRLAFDKIIQEMINIGNRYPNSMRIVEDDTREKEHLLVITANRDVYFLSKRENSQMFVDFPHYNNDIVLSINPQHDQYFTIDVAVKNTTYPDPDQYVFAGIGRGGYIQGKATQRIALIRPNGGLSRQPQFVLFAVGFD